MPQIPKIQVKNLRKSFGDKHVLKDVSFNVNHRESLVIIGASGTGKSVSIKCLVNVIPPDGGQILVDGVNILPLPKKQRLKQLSRFSMLFQGGALFDSLPVWENIAFRLLHEKRLNRRLAREIALQKMTAVDLPHSAANLPPAELSGGMQKRAALARAIAHDPEIILFDEPTTGLDPITAGLINQLIRARVKELNATAITITHDMASVRTIADRVAMIHQGTIIWTGSRDEMDSADNPFVRQFVDGNPRGPLTPDAPNAPDAAPLQATT